MYIGVPWFDFISIWCILLLFTTKISWVLQSTGSISVCHCLIWTLCMCVYYTFYLFCFCFFVEEICLNQTSWKFSSWSDRVNLGICFSSYAALSPRKTLSLPLLVKAALEFIHRNIYDACSTQKTLRLKINLPFLYLWMEFFVVCLSKVGTRSSTSNMYCHVYFI